MRKAVLDTKPDSDAVSLKVEYDGAGVMS